MDIRRWRYTIGAVVVLVLIVAGLVAYTNRYDHTNDAACNALTQENLLIYLGHTSNHLANRAEFDRLRCAKR